MKGAKSNESINSSIINKFHTWITEINILLQLAKEK